MAGKKIKVFIKRPGEKPYSTHISNSLKNLQNTVGGTVEMVRCKGGHIILCDEEGIWHERPYNCTYEGNMYFGTIIFCGENGTEFGDIGISYEQFKSEHGELFQ